MYSIASWWLRLLFVLVLPFAIVIGSYQTAMQFPGAVRLAPWEWFASTVFLVAVVPVFLVLRQPNGFGSARIAGGIFISVLFLYAALVMHVHATCEYIAPYIGGTPPAEEQVPDVQTNSAAAAQEAGC